MNLYMSVLVRYVPDVFVGEFVNVGVIVGSEDTGEWGMRKIANTHRAVAFGDQGTFDCVMEQMDVIQAAFDIYNETGDPPPYPHSSIRYCTKAWLDDLHENYYRGVNQFSEPAPALAETLHAAVDLCYAQVVDKPIDSEA